MSSTEEVRTSPYDTVDFKALAKKDDNFRKVWQKSSGHLDFQDPETVRVLTKAILRADFGLHLEVPDDRLCPPVPNRWNYVTWIQGLIDSTSSNYNGRYNPDRHVVGLDIGTGASAIYTMLCLKTRPNWTMCASDIDKKSFDSAVRNLTINNLVTRTKMLQTIDSQPLIPLQHLGVDRLDFTICNPPFFTDEKDMRSSLKGETKTWKPNAVCTGANVEMVCPGGDLGFVTRIVNESLVLRDKVTWYTSMLGKMGSAKAIVDLLKKHGITNWAVGVIEAGGPTKRWTVAWSFGDFRPKNATARMTTIANEYLPFPTEYRIWLDPEQPITADVAAAKSTTDSQLSSLDLRWAWNHETSSGIGEAAQNVWNRAYRRVHRKKLKELEAAGGQDSTMEGTKEDLEVALAFRIWVADGTREIVIEWLRGSDRVIFESFCGMVHQNFKKMGK